jgi:hypothetical protein
MMTKYDARKRWRALARRSPMAPLGRLIGPTTLLRELWEMDGNLHLQLTGEGWMRATQTKVNKALADEPVSATLRH